MSSEAEEDHGMEEDGITAVDLATDHHALSS